MVPPATTAERSASAVPNGVIGMIFFLGTETMVFAGLVSAFLVLRAGAPWPPPGQPRLPVAITALNTLVLLASGLTMFRAHAAARSDRRDPFRRRLLATALLGAAFLAVQGVEWVRLVRFGLTLTSSLYGAVFYALVGVHGLHVAAGLALLCFLLVRVSAESPAARGVVAACGLYWSFVVAVWPILYVLLYLA